MINNEGQLASILPVLTGADWIAIDTEADSLHAYPEKLCLLQISVPGHDWLVDPLAGYSLDPLWAALLGRELIFHGADYDLRLLRRGFSFVPTRIFDTMVAARLLGWREFSLTHLVGRSLGVTLEKGPQKMDWARRPLTERMMAYARNDTRYLHPVATLLRGELERLGRHEWMGESCAQLVQEAAQVRSADPETVWRIKGSDRLGPRGLGILREIWHWRELEAVEANKPPYFILSHEDLVNLAGRASHHSDLDTAVPRRLPTRRRLRLLEALRRGVELPPDQCPHPRRHVGVRLTRLEQRQFEELRDRRDRRAAELGIDPTLIASRGTLVDLARNPVQAMADLAPWQRRLLENGP